MFEQEGRRENGGNFDRCLGFTHVIKKGDTLYKLSRQYNVKVSALILANPYADVYNLQIGDEICIPKIRPVVIPITPYPQVRPYPPARPYEGGMPRQMTEETPARQGEEIPEEEGISEEFMDGMDEMMMEEEPSLFDKFKIPALAVLVLAGAGTGAGVYRHRKKKKALKEEEEDIDDEIS